MGVVEPVKHLLVGLHGLYENAVLHGFREQALYEAVALANITAELSHAVHVESAEQDEYGQDSHADAGQPLVHHKEVEERARKHGQRAERRREGLGEEVDDVVDIGHQAVDDIARMHGLATAPFRPQQSCEHLLLHAVLSLDAENVLDPDAGDAQGKLSKDDGGHDGYGPVDRAGLYARGSVDGPLHGPYRG